MLEIRKTVVTRQFIQDPEYRVDGLASTGTRRLTVTLPIVDEAGVRVTTLSREYAGAEFDQVWAAFDSDESMIARVLADLGVEADTSSVDGDITNVG